MCPHEKYALWIIITNISHCLAILETPGCCNQSCECTLYDGRSFRHFHATPSHQGCLPSYDQVLGQASPSEHQIRPTPFSFPDFQAAVNGVKELGIFVQAAGSQWYQSEPFSFGLWSVSELSTTQGTTTGQWGSFHFSDFDLFDDSLLETYQNNISKIILPTAPFAPPSSSDTCGEHEIYWVDWE